MPFGEDIRKPYVAGKEVLFAAGSWEMMTCETERQCLVCKGIDI